MALFITTAVRTLHPTSLDMAVTLTQSSNGNVRNIRFILQYRYLLLTMSVHWYPSQLLWLRISYGKFEFCGGPGCHVSGHSRIPQFLGVGIAQLR
jgi:hypothetical protein